MGYPGYFLIVQDFTTYARNNGVSVGPGRGSAAGSAIAYCLGITNIDPIKYDLLFERFLNPDRVSMPDIDIDFDDEGREKVIQYVVQKYGKDQVAQIITYGTMGGKSALRDTARVLNLPLPEADKLAKSFPDLPDAELKKLFTPNGIDTKLKEKLKERSELLQKAEDFIKLAHADNLQAQVINQATQLEGSVRNTGIHACGIIITPDELSKFVPVQKAKDSELLVTQFDNSVAEAAGLLKMDFLGLRTLTIIKDTIELIKKTRNITIDIDKIPLDDELTFKIFQKGQTKGIFQFESPGMQKHLRDLKPDKFDELIAMNALYRPGPLAYIPNFIKRKHGLEPITYDLPEMEEYLKDTYGITVYQEQVMLLSQKLAGFSKGDADVLRKAMGKKDKSTLDKMKNKFIEGSAAKGLPTETINKIWTDWEAFASYAFNKSHSTCYAYIAYQTAYLKAHYTPEFIAANLTHQMNTTEQVAFYLEECKELNIEVLGPDINESDYKFSVNQKGQIRVGMGAIKGVGENAVKAIVEEREKNGHYKSIFDLTKRVNLRTVNKKVLENLAYVGAFDQFKDVHRAQYFYVEKGSNLNTIEVALKHGAHYQESKNSAQISLFGEGSAVYLPEPQLPICEPWSNLEKLKKEKEYLGIYISGHPLDEYKFDIENFCNCSISQLKELDDKMINREYRFAGMVTSFSHKISKNGSAFGSIRLEDYDSDIELMLFSNDYINYRNFMIEGLFLWVKARIEKRKFEDRLDIRINKIELLNEVRQKNTSLLNINLDLNNITQKFIDDFTEVVHQYKGETKLKITILDNASNYRIEMPSRQIKINPTNQFISKLKELGIEEIKLN
jgi:DNA polymerase-3 subunit alpha